MNDKALAAFREHTIAEHPKEACGFLVAVGKKDTYFPVKNIADNPLQDFKCDPRDYLRAQQLGSIIGICHSHPEALADPSPADLTGCEASRLPWYILSWPENRLVRFEPSGYVAPLLGRPFTSGVHDCYGLVRDYYAQVCQIELPDIDREPDWWLDRPGKPHLNLYVDNFESFGFVRVDPKSLQVHDGILMQIGQAVVPCHAGVYIGDGIMMHHFIGQLSCRTVYGGHWQKHTTHVLRHRSFM